MLDVVEAKYLKDYLVEVVFENQEKGVADLREYANRGGVFSRFSDLDYFKQVYVNRDIGTLCWPGDLDIAPETVYRLASL